MEYLIALLTGVIASLIATGVLALSVIKPFIEKTKKDIARLINPVQRFKDAGELVHHLNEAFASYKDRERDLVMYRALPLEITEIFFERVDHVIDRETILEYQNVLRRIIMQGNGNWDKTIFGRTGITKLDFSTWEIVNMFYFHRQARPNTSHFGIHKNLDEIGIILIGSGDDPKDPQNVVWSHGFIIIFSPDYKQMRGFVHIVPQHINNLLMIFQQKQQDSILENTYWDLEYCSDGEYKDACDTAKDFFGSLDKSVS